MRIEHMLALRVDAHRPIRVLVLGAGGTGSAVTMGLPYLDQALRVWGRFSGLEVVLMDADTVSETNCIRQPFSISDIGQNKATVLINRINLFWGTSWRAEPRNFGGRTFERIQDTSVDFLIGCVDSRSARCTIARCLVKANNRTAYWLDLGNSAASGQFVLGQPLNGRNRRKAERLRTVTELYEEIADADAGEDPLPSCSAVEALERQEPFINQTLAMNALSMLARLLRYGKIAHHGGFLNAATGKMTALPVDPELWRKTRRRSQKMQTKQPTR
jgi:PRTRC genetic system ThiF family protein